VPAGETESADAWTGLDHILARFAELSTMKPGEVRTVEEQEPRRMAPAPAQREPPPPD
jgi:hypothetical protein